MEYEDHSSYSIYVKFPVANGQGRFRERTSLFPHLDYNTLDFACQ